MDGTADTLHSQVCGPHDGASHTSTPWSWTLKAYKWGKKRRRGITSWPDMIKMELSRVHLLLGAVGFLLWTSGGSAAPMECHFSSRGEIQFFITLFKKNPKHLPLKKPPSVYKKMYYFELFPPPCVRPALCVYEGRHYSLGETWMDNACMQCTCLHPVGVGCCETWVHKQTVWFGVQMPTVSKPHGFKRLSDFVFMVEQQFHQMFCLRIKKVATNVVSLQESCLCGFFLLILF